MTLPSGRSRRWLGARGGLTEAEELERSSDWYCWYDWYALCLVSLYTLLASLPSRWWADVVVPVCCRGVLGSESWEHCQDTVSVERLLLAKIYKTRLKESDYLPGSSTRIAGVDDVFDIANEGSVGRRVVGAWPGEGGVGEGPGDGRGEGSLNDAACEVIPSPE